MNNSFLTLIALIIILSSCQVIRTRTAKATDIQNNGIIQKPTIVDLEVNSTKVIGTANSAGNQTLEAIKNSAISDATKKANCDLLVEPIYEIETNAGVTKVTVIGYPATYKNFRPMVEDDIKLIQIGSIKKVNTSDSPIKKRSSIGLIVGIIIAIPTIFLSSIIVSL
jgi:hypothetical protein